MRSTSRCLSNRPQWPYMHEQMHLLGNVFLTRILPCQWCYLDQLVNFSWEAVMIKIEGSTPLVQPIHPSGFQQTKEHESGSLKELTRSTSHCASNRPQWPHGNLPSKHNSHPPPKSKEAKKEQKSQSTYPHMLNLCQPNIVKTHSC